MDPTIIGAGIGAIGNLASAKMSADFAKGMSREQMIFQQTMSSTAHQRQVADMRAAGLNPILSATGGHGASTPPGATATMPDARLGDAITQGASAAQSRRLMRQQEAIGRETERKTKAEGDAAESEAYIADYERRVYDAMRHNYKEGGIDLEAKRRMADAKAATTAADIERELDEGAGEATRMLRRLGITGGSAAQILNVFRERSQRFTPRYQRR